MVGEQRSTQRIPLEPWEVGGELLDILSRGLYNDAKDALREYVQNSVDAGADSVYITVDGPIVTVRDDGHGMDFDTLRRARRLGASDKGLPFNVGFRGIGIYSAFGMCDTLTIYTHQTDSPELLELRMAFGEMSLALERDRSAPIRSNVSLTDLLFEHTTFVSTAFSGNPSESFTMVRLEGLQPEYRSQLSNLSKVHDYLLNTLPVMFPDVSYGREVNQWMSDVLELNPVRVILRVGKEPEVIVGPPIATGVQEPSASYLTDEDGRELAFMWYALSSNRGQVSVGQAGASDSDVSGFLLKIKGFTLGNRSNVKHLWPLVGARALYHHYTGEIHVLEEAGAVPNAARNDLEAGRSRDVLFRYLEDKFAVLNSEADVARQILKIREDLTGSEDEARKLLARRDSPDESPFELYRISKNFIDDIERSERALQRLKGRGRSRRARTVFPPSDAQSEEIAELLRWVKEPKEIASRVVRATESRTSSKGSGKTPEPKEPASPQVALLKEALDSLVRMGGDLPPDRFAATQAALEAALRLQVVPNAIVALDDLKAAGFGLSEAAESSRRQLRSHLGWSPNAPVSLFEALAEDGFLPGSPRERALIQAIDDGLRSGLGGRGEAYENLLRAIAEAISNHPELR
ncbi:MAG: ATP-binding protein [Chloroflexota bacterium]|nr:ATP-binding protein [Chloroflexota bacterium]